MTQKAITGAGDIHTVIMHMDMEEVMVTAMDLAINTETAVAAVMEMVKVVAVGVAVVMVKEMDLAKEKVMVTANSLQI